MRKFVSLMFIVSMLFLTLMAGIIDEAIKNSEIVQNKIKELNLYWSAGGNTEFFKKFEKFNPTFDEVLEKLCGTRVLPDDYKEKLFNYLRMLSDGMRGIQPFGMTTTDDLIMGSLVLAKPESVLDSYFYRLEPVRDQMFHGSCWAFSTIGSFESAYAIQVLNKDEGNVDNELDFSERWVAYHNIDWDIYTFSLYELIQDKNSLEGGNPYFAMFNATRYGEIKEEYAPYSEVFLTADEVIPLPAQAFGAPRYKSSKTLIIPSAPDAKALGYGYDEYISMIKSAIKNYGSLSVVYYVLNDFASYTHGVYTPTTDIIAGAHAVTLVGWASLEDLDDIVLSEKTNPDATPVLDTEPSTFVYYDPTRGKTYTADLFWIVKNSWGYDWGDGGYYVVPAIDEKAYEEGNPGGWMFESFSMYVPIFENTSKHEDTNLDLNEDGKVDKADFEYLVSKIGSNEPNDIEKCDIAYPRDGKITSDDVATWIYLYNERNKK